MNSDLSEVRSEVDANFMRTSRYQPVRNSMEDLKRHLQGSGEEEALKYLSKFELVNENMTLGREFIKKIFEASRTFNTWTRIIEFIIRNYEAYSRLFEIKTLKLCSQSLKIDAKIDPKQLFDLSFFSFVVPGATEEKYNSAVFEHLRTNIIKLVNDSNVHALAKAFFYGMGLVKRYEYMVYLLYLDARLEEYINSPFNNKQELSLLEKIKSVYSKLAVETRDSGLRDLLRVKFDAKAQDKLKAIVGLL